MSNLDASIGFEGVCLFLLIFYLLLEVSTIIISKSLIIHKIFIYFRLRKQLKKIIPSWWRIKEISILTIIKKPIGYNVYVEILSKIEKDKWTNDWIIVDYLGRIKHQELSSGIELFDKGREMKIKEWNRDKVLNDLGI